MSSRLMRTLLKLYPRRIRHRYGEELLDLHDELWAHRDVSRTRLIRDTIAGALLVRSARQRAYLGIAAVIVIVGLALAGTIIAGPATNSPAGASRAQARHGTPTIDAAPYSTCFVAAGSSCSLAACTEYVANTSADHAVGNSNKPAARRRLHATEARCAAYPDAGGPHLFLVSR